MDEAWYGWGMVMTMISQHTHEGQMWLSQFHRFDYGKRYFLSGKFRIKTMGVRACLVYIFTSSTLP